MINLQEAIDMGKKYAAMAKSFGVDYPSHKIIHGVDELGRSYGALFITRLVIFQLGHHRKISVHMIPWLTIGSVGSGVDWLSQGIPGRVTKTVY